MAAITDTRSFVRAVQDLFGVERLREHQQSTLRALLDGRDVFLSVRTGGGKSLCYMGFPAAAKALAKAETELGQAPDILSPLIAIMNKQCDKLTSLGLKATRLGMNTAETTDILAGKFQYLYTSHETILEDGRFRGI
ncbi:hypothetical protein Bbelb_394060 [Branchiostoma belcheri]|nr:hypothetical protein Bbelb_394060 [Branchiostoma belcheri]